MPDVEYMVWKLLYMSCLEACICLYPCVMSAMFTCLWQLSDLGEALHIHTHCQGHLLPVASFFPSTTRHSLNPRNETQTHHELLEANTGPVWKDRPASGSTHWRTQAVWCQLAHLMATTTSMLVNGKTPCGRWPRLKKKITKISTLDWADAGFKPSFHLNFHFYYLYKSFYGFIADIFMELTYSREM